MHSNHTARTHVQVSSGMYASFAQYVGAIVLDEEATAKHIAHLSSAASLAASSKDTKKTKKPAPHLSGSGPGGGNMGPMKHDMSQSDPILGKLLVMGNVTKKLVITPDFPIGE